MRQCTNPSSHFCNCDACSVDRSEVANARNRVSYGKHKNSIVEWMLSEEWTQPPNTMPMRGMTEVNGMHTAHSDGTNGEIPWRKFDGLSRKFV